LSESESGRGRALENRPKKRQRLASTKQSTHLSHHQPSTFAQPDEPPPETLPSLMHHNPNITLRNQTKQFNSGRPLNGYGFLCLMSPWTESSISVVIAKLCSSTVKRNVNE